MTQRPHHKEYRLLGVRPTIWWLPIKAYKKIFSFSILSNATSSSLKCRYFSALKANVKIYFSRRSKRLLSKCSKTVDWMRKSHQFCHPIRCQNTTLFYVWSFLFANCDTRRRSSNKMSPAIGSTIFFCSISPLDACMDRTNTRYLH